MPSIPRLRFALIVAFVGAARADVELRNGDVIFQASSSKRSYAFMWTSKSLYSYVGIVEVDGNKTDVLEAISKVSRTPPASGSSAGQPSSDTRNSAMQTGQGTGVWSISK